MRCKHTIETADNDRSRTAAQYMYIALIGARHRKSSWLSNVASGKMGIMTEETAKPQRKGKQKTSMKPKDAVCKPSQYKVDAG